MPQTDIRAMQPRQIYGLALAGFSAAFALYLLRGLGHGDGVLAAALNLLAAVLLIAVFALSLPDLKVALMKSPARVGLRARLGMAVAACLLALLARSPWVIS